MEYSKILDEGHPENDSRAFRKCLGQYGTGVTLITTAMDGQRAGVTVNSFASVSLDPPLILWSISRTSRSFPLFEKSHSFIVHILASNQTDLSRHFSSSTTDKFSSMGVRLGRNGAPLLDGVVAYFECDTEAVYDGGDHLILIGRVSHYARFDGEPLIFVQGRYGVTAEHPDFRGPENADQSILDTPELSALSLLFRAQYRLSESFDVHRAEEDMGLPHIRILIQAYEQPGITLDRVLQLTYLGERDANDTVVELVKRKLLICNADGGLILTERGRHLREVIRKRWLNFEEKQIEGINMSDIRIFRNVLKTILAKNQI